MQQWSWFKEQVYLTLQIKNKSPLEIQHEVDIFRWALKKYGPISRALSSMILQENGNNENQINFRF